MKYHADKRAVIGCSIVSDLFVTPWTIARQATVFLPGESHGQRSLVGYSPWGQKELDMTGAT